MAAGAGALVLSITVSPSQAQDAVVMPASFSPVVSEKRQAFEAAQPKLTTALLEAYVARQQQLHQFHAFDVPSPDEVLTTALLSSYIAKQRNEALEAIDSVDVSSKPALTADVLSRYAEDRYVPTVKKVKVAGQEKQCLAQAIYHEARGETVDGQWAVANVIINRALSKKYPTTLCGVVFQNADKGRYKCQFTFACDGRSDDGKERGAWNRAVKMADAAYREFATGDRPGVIPSSALYYHTRSVNPGWSNKFRQVATIGSHIFYSTN